MSTLVDKIVHDIREDIYNGQLIPGQPLKQVELANRYGVSPIPLREALQRLQVEGLVEYFAYRGAIVARIRKCEAIDVAGIREALESLAFRIALPTLDDEQINRIERVVTQLDSARAWQEAGFFMSCMLELYAILLEKVDRPLLLEMIQTNLKRATRYYAEVVRLHGSEPLQAPSRQVYMDALRARDYDRLMAVLNERHEVYVAFFEANVKD